MRAPRTFQWWHRAGASRRRDVDRSFAVVVVAVAATASGGLGCGEYPDPTCGTTDTRLRDDGQAAPALGFAPDDVLAWALGFRTEQATWIAPPAGVRVSGAAAASELQLGLTRRKGLAVQTVYEDWCGPKPQLRIPVMADVTTSDGALSESLPGTLISSRVGFARLEAELSTDVENGSLEIASDDPQLHLQASFGASLTPDGSAGGIGLSVERRTAEAHSLLPGFSLLRWPVDSACNHEVIAGALDPSDPDWAQPIASAGTASWSGALAQDGTPLAASVALEPAGVLCESESGTVSAPATLHLTFADGRAGVTLQTVLVRAQDRLELATEWPTGYWGGPPDTFAARYSDFGLELARYDHIELKITLSLAENEMRGNLALIGFEDMCPSTTCGNTGCAGCGQFAQVVLLELSAD